MLRKKVSFVALAAMVFIAVFATLQGASAAPTKFADPLFETKWTTTDAAVANGTATYSWVFGPTPGASPQEPYTEAPGGQRLVQYFDKARMEKTNRTTNPNAVTSGNLTTELVSGQQQNGDATFVTKTPASVPVAGDSDDATGPTYASFQSVATVPGAAHPAPKNIGEITDTISRAGVISPFTGTRPVVAKNAYYIAETKHNIPDVFFSWLTTKAPGNWIEIVGYPIGEAYWATVKVSGVQKTVLMQLYERRALTFTASNSPQYQVEYGNIGQHYYTWRYGTNPPPTTTPPTSTSPTTPTTTPTTTPSPTTTPPTSDYNPEGIWRGKTSQNTPVFFTVDKGAVTTLLFFVTLAGCDNTEFGVRLSKPKVLTTDKAFAILGTDDEGTSILVDGTVDSSTGATVNISVVYGTDNPKCKGTITATGTLTKDPLSTDTAHDGIWTGKSNVNNKTVTFEVVHHVIRSFAIPYVDKDQCKLSTIGLNQSAFADYDYPNSIKADNTFLIKDGDPTYNFTFTGALTSATNASGNFQIIVNKVAPPGYYVPCNGQANGTFTATKQPFATATTATNGSEHWTNRHSDNAANEIAR